MREVIREHYFEKLKFKQIGERHGYDPERARQTHSKALDTLRRDKLGAKPRSVYGDDYEASNTYGHKSFTAFKRSSASEVEDYVMRRLGSRQMTAKLI